MIDKQQLAEQWTSVRWTPKQYSELMRRWSESREAYPTLSSFIRAAALDRPLSVHKSFTDPSQVASSVNRVGRNIDRLLHLAEAGYGIGQGEITSLSEQMRTLNKSLETMYRDYHEHAGEGD